MAETAPRSVLVPLDEIGVAAFSRQVHGLMNDAERSYIPAQLRTRGMFELGFRPGIDLEAITETVKRALERHNAGGSMGGMAVFGVMNASGDVAGPAVAHDYDSLTVQPYSFPPLFMGLLRKRLHHRPFVAAWTDEDLRETSELLETAYAEVSDRHGPAVAHLTRHLDSYDRMGADLAYRAYTTEPVAGPAQAQDAIIRAGLSYDQTGYINVHQSVRRTVPLSYLFVRNDPPRQGLDTAPPLSHNGD